MVAGTPACCSSGVTQDVCPGWILYTRRSGDTRTFERRERQARGRLLERARDECGSREEYLGRLLAQSVQGTPSLHLSDDGVTRDSMHQAKRLYHASVYTASPPARRQGQAAGLARGLYDRSTARASAAHDRVACALSRSAVSCGSSNCVRDAPQPQPHPQLSSLAVSDNAEGGSIVKGSNVDVDIASPFRGIDKGCGSCACEVSLPRH